MTEWRRALVDRLAPLGLRPEREAEIVEELSQHLDDHVRELLAGGAGPAEARTDALADLDAPGELARRLAEIEARPPLNLPPPGTPSRGRWFHARWQDIRQSMRALRRSPTFTATVVVTLALTIGPTTAMLSIGNWLLWRPTPGVTEPDRLAVIWVGTWRETAGSVSVGVSGVSYLNLADLRNASRTLTGIAGLQEGSATISADNLPSSMAGGAWVTADAFDVLGVRMAAGRTFRAEEDREPRGEPVAVVSESLARRAFGNAAAAVDRPLRVNGRDVTIVGVASPDFTGTTPFGRVDVWYPGASYGYVNHFVERDRQVTREDGLFYSFVARLAPGASFEAVRAELDVLVPALAASHPDQNGKFKTVRARVYEGLGPDVLERPRYQSLVGVLLAVGAALLLLGCANVTNMLMLRSLRTQRDRAVRLALGASRSRLVMLQLTESALLAVGGAVLGVLLAAWLKQVVATLLVPGLAAGPGVDVPLDLRVLAMTLTISLSCGLFAGFVPAIAGGAAKSSSVLATAGGRSVTGTRWLRSGFAALQLAVSLALVTGSLMLLATLRNLYAVDLGFDPAGVTVHNLNPNQHGYSADRALTYFVDVRRRLEGTPGLDVVALSFRAPFGARRGMRLPDPGGGTDPIQIYSNSVMGDYFDALRIPMIRGRTFTDAEAFAPAGGAAYPVIIGERLARRLFGDADAVGRHMTLPAAGSSPVRDVTVIGVARDMHWSNVTTEPELFLYQPFVPSGDVSRSATLLIKSSLPTRDVTQRVEAAAREVDPSMPVDFSRSLSASVDAKLADRRVFAWVLSRLGWLGYLLAAVGLYGLLAQSVTERTREFGIRMAIGSGRGRIFGLVLRQAAWIGGFGTIAGLALAMWSTRLVEAQLFGVTRLDPITYVASAVSLLVVVLVAGLWPARAATRIQPVDALRVE